MAFTAKTGALLVLLVLACVSLMSAMGRARGPRPAHDQAQMPPHGGPPQQQPYPNYQQQLRQNPYQQGQAPPPQLGQMPQMGQAPMPGYPGAQQPAAPPQYPQGYPAQQQPPPQYQAQQPSAAAPRAAAAMPPTVVPAPPAVPNPLERVVQPVSPTPSAYWAGSTWRANQGPWRGAEYNLGPVCKSAPSDDFVHVLGRMAADDGVPLHTIIDVGGNLGRFTEKILEGASRAGVPLKNVVTFEPNKLLLNEYNTRVNGAVARLNMQATNLTFVAAGVGAVDEVLTLHLGTDSGKSGFAAAKTKYHSGKTVQMPVTRLDTFFKANPQLLPIDFLKIDVEGLEMQVLRGAAALLGQCADCVQMIQFEFGGAWKDSRCPEKVGLQQVVGTLDKFGFDSYIITKAMQMFLINRGSLAQMANKKCAWTNIIAVRRTNPRAANLRKYLKVSGQ